MTATHRCAMLFVLLALTGCATKWEVQKAPAADVLKFSDGDVCLVTRASGTQVELREARVQHDSVIGVKKDEATGPAENARLAIALTDVRSIAIRKPDGVATTFWASLAGVFAVMLAFGALMSAAYGGT